MPFPASNNGPTAPGAWAPPKYIARGNIDLDNAPDSPAQPLATVPAKRQPLSLPSPEEAGVTGPRAAGIVDWNATRARLQQLGGIGLQLGQLADGSFRVAFVMLTNQVNCYHHIEATAATEAEAVSAAIVQAEQWASGK
jgi:hypothetical protein